MNYGNVFTSALRTVVEDYEAGRFGLDSEADLRSWLFSACVAELEEKSDAFPLPIHAEKPLGSGKRPDLQLGSPPVEAIELKLQTTTGNSIKLKKSEGANSIQADLEKVRDYARRGTTGHLVFVEVDDGTMNDYYWPKTIPQGWIKKETWKYDLSRLAWVDHVVAASTRTTRR